MKTTFAQDVFYFLLAVGPPSCVSHSHESPLYLLHFTRNPEFMDFWFYPLRVSWLSSPAVTDGKSSDQLHIWLSFMQVINHRTMSCYFCAWCSGNRNWGLSKLEEDILSNIGVVPPPPPPAHVARARDSPAVCHLSWQVMHHVRTLAGWRRAAEGLGHAKYTC